MYARIRTDECPPPHVDRLLHPLKHGFHYAQNTHTPTKAHTHIPTCTRTHTRTHARTHQHFRLGDCRMHCVSVSPFTSTNYLMVRAKCGLAMTIVFVCLFRLMRCLCRPLPVFFHALQLALASVSTGPDVNMQRQLWLFCQRHRHGVRRQRSDILLSLSRRL